MIVGERTSKASTIDAAAWSINLAANPSLLCDLLTAKDVICPCGSSSAASSSIFASTYPTTLPCSSSAMYDSCANGIRVRERGRDGERGRGRGEGEEREGESGERVEKKS